MRKTRPGIVALLFASGVACCCLIVSAGGLVLTNDLRVTSTIELAAEKLRGTDIVQTKLTLRDRFDNPPLENRFMKIIEGERADSRLESALRYTQVPESIKSSQLLRVTATRAWIENEEDSPTKTAILQTLDSSQAMLESLELEKARWETFSDSSSQLNNEYLAVAKRFGSLLSLEPIEPKAGSRTLPVYVNGYLSGLPKLAGSNDEIETLEKLGETLPKIGGKVTIEGRQVAQAFDEEISALRGLTAGLVKSREEVRFEEEKSDGRRAEFKQKVSTLTQAAARLTADHLVQIASQEPEWASGSSWYRRARSKIEELRKS